MIFVKILVMIAWYNVLQSIDNLAVVRRRDTHQCQSYKLERQSDDDDDPAASESMDHGAEEPTRDHRDNVGQSPVSRARFGMPDPDKEILVRHEIDKARRHRRCR